MNILLMSLNTKYVHSNLAIRYIREYCKNLPIDIKVEEYTINQHIEDIVGEILKNEYDVICLSVYIWNLEENMRVAEMIKDLRPSIEIVMGGPEVSYDADLVLKKHPYVDIIMRGEGEATSLDCFKTLYDGNGLDKVLGITYRNKDKIIENNDRPLICDLTTVPFPYTEMDLKSFENKIVYYESSRGCPFNCAFCLSSTIRGLRYFDIDRVKQDLKKLLDARVKQIKFVDRTFNASKNHAKEIMSYIIKNDNNHTNVHFEITAHLVDEEFLNLLEKAPVGLFQLEIGVQTTNPNTIEAIHRTTNFEQLSKVVQRINEIGKAHQHLDLIAGLPFENYESFGNSFDDVYRLEPDKIQLGFLKLLKGSALRQDSKKHGYKFSKHPVYEVYENKYMNFKEFRRLKVVEDLVEKYGNERRFYHSLDFLIKHHKLRPFKVFESLADYWVSKEYHLIQHGLKRLYEILEEYYKNTYDEDLELFKELLKFDYMKTQNGKLLKENILDKSFNQQKHEFLKDDNQRSKYLPGFENMPTKKLINIVTIEKFKYDIIKLIESDYEDIKLEEKIYLFSKHGGYLKYEIYDVSDVSMFF